MSGTNYLIDTCTLIGLQKRTDDSMALLAGKNIHQCAISLVTYMEFVGFYGVDRATAKTLEQIANSFTCLPISQSVAQKTIEIRQQYKINLPDALILATAKTYGLELLTLDDKLERIASTLNE